MRTIARRDGDAWVLDGSKSWITNAGIANWYVVFAITDPDERRSTAFVVECDRDGFSVPSFEHKLGVHGSPTGTLLFDGVRVPDANRIGDAGKGLSVALATLERSRLAAAAQALGIAQGATDYAARYAEERIAFGKPLFELQGIQFKLADMQTKKPPASCSTRPTRSPTLATPHRHVRSMAKLFASGTAMDVTIEAIQVLGGHGYVRDHPVERMMRDAKITQIYEGTNEIQRLVIARQMRR